MGLRLLEEVTAEDAESHAFYRSKLARIFVCNFLHILELLWTAPEILRESTNFTNVTEVMLAHKLDAKMMQKADLYSFALILHEMLFRKGLFWSS
jgi:hypothetical protein